MDIFDILTLFGGLSLFLFGMNVMGQAVWITVFCLIRAVFRPLILFMPATLSGIAVIHSVFNILCTVLMLPMSGFLEALVKKLIPESRTREKRTASLQRRQRC